MRDYDHCSIRDIHRGDGSRSVYIYAKVELLIVATLDYCVQAITERLPITAATLQQTAPKPPSRT